jgi:hypothetical protein
MAYAAAEGTVPGGTTIGGRLKWETPAVVSRMPPLFARRPSSTVAGI